MREMAKNGGFADGGIVGIRSSIDDLAIELRAINERYRMRMLLNTEEATLRYQEVILGIERRWDAVMRRLDTNN